MKKIICVGLMLILCMSMLTGCSKAKTDVTESTVFVEKKGQIVSVDVEELDKEYYDAAELEEYITEHVADYTTENGETVTKENFLVEEGIAKLEMKYASYEDYSNFNGIEFYEGTVLEAQAEGYDFDTEFYALAEESDEAAGTKQKAGKTDVLADDESKVVIIRANVAVQVKGKILYVSAEDTEVIDKKTVRITGEGANEEAALTYIIYK
ncbi:MAG: hypothetical protein J6A75_02140 [Lachnospiraceae bacterium]|nr:hypothetical protein [Lachnospiraceae bacterium]